MLTLNECRKLVDPKKEKYTDKELEVMVSFLSKLMATMVENINKESYEESCIDGQGVK